RVWKTPRSVLADTSRTDLGTGSLRIVCIRAFLSQEVLSTTLQSLWTWRRTDAHQCPCGSRRTGMFLPSHPRTLGRLREPQPFPHASSAHRPRSDLRV